MPTIPRPKVLPRITYAPPQDAPPQNMQAGGQAGSNPYIDIVGDPSSQVSKPPGWEDRNLPQAAGMAQGMIGYNPQPPSITQQAQGMGTPMGVPQADRRSDPIEQVRTQQQDAQFFLDTANKNRNLLQKAQGAGDTSEIARLNAEWERLAPTAQKYGITPERLVGSYMQPSNPAAKGTLREALAAAIADNVWGDEATRALGRPPNQLEWDEHWRAMNIGGRDVLDGHPQAIQNIQARMKQIQDENQRASSDQYQQWLNSR